MRVRVVSMQGKEVWNKLKCDKVYKADVALSREKVYKEDMDSLGGLAPIRCFYYPTPLQLELYDGVLLERLRCEMSLPATKGCFDNFLMFEIEIDSELLHDGVGHNDCSWCMIFSKLTIDMVVGVYQIRDSCVIEDVAVINPIYLNCEYPNPITDVEITCNLERTDCSGNIELVGMSYGEDGYCLRCGHKTNSLYYGKHLCSTACASVYSHRFVVWCSVRGIDKYWMHELFVNSDDNDFKGGISFLVDKYEHLKDVTL